MSKLNDLTRLTNSGSDVRERKTPEAWRPRLEVDEKGGFFVSTPQPNPVGDVVDLLSEFDLNPDEWDVTSCSPVEVATLRRRMVAFLPGNSGSASGNEWRRLRPTGRPHYEVETVEGFETN
jgi:hypothetical protein